MSHRSSRGQALVWFTLSLPLFLATAGLAIDGSLLLTSRRELQSVADGAARAAATRLDLERLRASGGADVQLYRPLAVEVARSYLDERLAAESGLQAAPLTEVDVDSRRVHVLIQGTLPTAFLRVVHIDNVLVQASATADVQYGIRDGAGGP